MKRFAVSTMAALIAGGIFATETNTFNLAVVVVTESKAEFKALADALPATYAPQTVVTTNRLGGIFTNVVNTVVVEGAKEKIKRVTSAETARMLNQRLADMRIRAQAKAQVQAVTVE
jgi:hypothetical protein